MDDTDKFVHCFNVEIAEELGVIPAILFHNITFWIYKNSISDNNEKFHDGRFWMWDTLESFADKYPYLTKDQIRYALNKLIEAGYIVTGNYNLKGYDRKKWYTLSDKALQLKSVSACFSSFGKIPTSIWENSHIHLGNLPHPFGKIPTPIAYIDTDKDTDIDADSIDIFEKKIAKDVFSQKYIGNTEKNSDSPLPSVDNVAKNSADAVFGSQPLSTDSQPTKEKIKRKHRLPDNWTLPDEWRNWALSQGRTEAQINYDADCFADYWHSKAETRADWFATWRNWERKNIHQQPYQRKISKNEERKQFLDALTGRNRIKQSNEKIIDINEARTVCSY